MNKPTKEQLIKLSETIRDHLTKQKCSSIDDAGECKYRGPSGVMCAAGAVITDDYYSDKLEGLTVGDAAVKDAISLSQDIFVDSTTEQLLRMWQSYHDSGDYDPWCKDDTQVARTSPEMMHTIIARKLDRFFEENALV